MLNSYPRIKNRKAKRMFYLADLVEENVRSRVIFPLALLAGYVLFVFSIIGTVTTVFTYFIFISLIIC